MFLIINAKILKFQERSYCCKIGFLRIFLNILIIIICYFPRGKLAPLLKMATRHFLYARPFKEFHHCLYDFVASIIF